MMKTHSTSSSGNKLSCFFCLRSRSDCKKYSNPQCESDSCENAEEETVSSFHEFSLRNLYRYLKSLHSDKEEKDFSDLKMSICEDCFRLNGEFNKLFDLLEETKLRLNWCIHKIQDVMTKAKKNESRIPLEVELKKKEEDVDEEKILEIWRTHTLDRIKAISGASFPQVLLRKYKRKRLSSVSNVSECEWTAEEERTGEMLTEEENLRLITSDKTMDTETMAIAQPLLQHLDVEDEGHDDLSHSSFIPSQIRSLTPPENDEMETIMECNSNAVEPEPEPCTVNSPCLTSVEKNMSNSASWQTRTNTDGTGASSTDCSITKSSSLNTMQSLEPKEKFKVVSDDPAVQEEKLSSSDSEEHEQWNCRYCQFKCSAAGYARRNSAQKHLVHFHPEHFLFDASERDEETSGFKFRSKQFQTILTEIVLPGFITYKGQYASCSLCKVKFKRSNVLSLSRHLILSHKAQVKEEVRILLEDVYFGERLQEDQEGIYSKCPYCRLKCGPGPESAIERHLVLFHPEHFLIEGMEEKPNDLVGLRHPRLQFQRILRDMIFPKFVSITVNGQDTKCSVCDMKYTAGQKRYVNIVFARKHLLSEHMSELKESIKVILEDPQLQGTLAGSSSSADNNGVTCSCGIYFQDSETTILNYHKRFHCQHNHTSNVEKSTEKVRSNPRSSRGKQSKE